MMRSSALPGAPRARGAPMHGAGAPPAAAAARSGRRRGPAPAAAAAAGKRGAAGAPPPELVVGVDLGTTNSAVARMKGGAPVCIPNGDGDTLTPSIVCERPPRARLTHACAGALPAPPRAARPARAAAAPTCAQPPPLPGPQRS